MPNFTPRAASLRAEADHILNTAQAQNRALTPEESTRFDALVDGLKRESREHAAAAARPASVVGQSFDVRSGLQRAYVTSEPSTYRKGDPSTSYVRDLYDSRVHGSRDAFDRLERNTRENRALSNSGQTSVIGSGGGSGGELAPPSWLVSEYAKLARPGRPIADAVQQMTLSPGVSSVNIPRIATGTSTAVQSAQNTALSQTDLTTNSVSSSITTIGGKQVVSQQLLDQSGTNLDEVIFGDLLADYYRTLDTQVLSGTGASGQLRGLLGVSGITAITYTDASPSVAGAGKFYAQVAKMVATTNASRYASLTCLAMRPERWGWLQASFDSQSRPLFLPTGDQGPMNSTGILDRVAPEAVVGHMHGLPVIVDANIPVTGGQDVVIGLRASDLWLWSSDVRMEAFTATYADSVGVLLRCYAYHAFVPDRQVKSIATLTGTGLAFPPSY